VRNSDSAVGMQLRPVFPFQCFQDWINPSLKLIHVITVTRHLGTKTIWTQDTSALVWWARTVWTLSTSVQVSKRQFGFKCWTVLPYVPKCVALF